ncbi:hypothetical protein CONCODRAFT_72162 [Conidiobolus coronatus NRRL 28638]|uniref:CCHC-type domain-containing protein n=1 Tax=Conidiobolus coronatus (strain ATCC 28846 / CBS 209.66 / NRRL 28638) TaxID=796925 RepID=A0A137P0U7_CONC2|nr:hypothetical protein CONCODRAFT_72162 [Conidiobolus coronatus NRRL 28638]|eukprot:KXN68578.1 hypothetical protein CONCODRAFT_72162 [Conidiobolus coronatus NRRL 28638]
MTGMQFTEFIPLNRVSVIIIPREIDFGNMITYVNPKNAPVRCFMCKELGHIKYECEKIHSERRRIRHSQQTPNNILDLELDKWFSIKDQTEIAENIKKFYTELYSNEEHS